jgi:hypothetical protein
MPMKENDPNYKQHHDKDLDLPENQTAKLHVIGAAITTLGEAIITIAALSELQELEEKQRLNSKHLKILKEHSRKLDQMQKQIDFLTHQMSKKERRKR